MSSASALVVAERLFAAITAGDVDAVGALYAADAVIWHNNDGMQQTPAQNLRVLGWVTKYIANLRYTDVRRQATPDGFVQQHVLRGTAPTGQAVEIPACIVCTVIDGKITRLDEYLDSAHLVALLASA